MSASVDDPYSRLQYRRLIAWPGRIRREAPLLDEVLGSGPERRVLDLGCGTGEHSRFLAEQGYEAVGVDRSTAQLTEARSGDATDAPLFLEADLTALDDVPELAPASFGGALCLGNTLPHLVDHDALGRFLGGVRRLLLPDAPFLVQLLNYERIFSEGARHLPLNLRDDPDGGEIVFLRLMELDNDGMVTFCPTSLSFDANRDDPVRVKSSRRVRLRGWRRRELDEAFRSAGFGSVEALGDFNRQEYDSLTSNDLLLIAC